MPRRSRHSAAVPSGVSYRPRRTRRRPRLSPDPFTIALVALSLFKLALVRTVVLGHPGAGVAGLWLELMAVVALVGTTSLLGKKGRLPALAVYEIFSVVCWANAMYAAYFRQAFDYALIGLAGQTAALGDVIRELLKPWHLLFFADVPLLLFVALSSRSQRPHNRRPVAVAAFVALAVFSIQVGLASRASAGVDVTTVAGSHGLVPAQAASLGTAVFGQRASANSGGGAATVARFRNELGIYDPRSGGERLADFGPGVARGKNVVFVQWESLQGFVVNGKVDGQEVTPRLNEFAAESWTFPNSYSQTGAGNTSDAEFVANTGLLGPVTKPSSVAYSPYEIPGLPRLVREQLGYESFTMHTNRAAFWNRRELYPALGYSAYYDRAYFKNRDKMWSGSSDEVLFQEASKVFAEKAGKGPVLLEIVTMTSHGPFHLPPEDRRPVKIDPKHRESIAGAYVTSLSFTDAAFGRFIDDLKRRGLYDDTVIVVFGDHTGYQTAFPKPEDDAVLSQLLGGRRYDQVDRQNVPILVHVPGQTEGRLIESVRAQADIMPTIAGLLGIDLSEIPHVGRDLFEEGERLIPTRYYYPPRTYVTGRTLVIPGIGGAPTQAFSLATGRKTSASRQDLAADATVKVMNRLSDEWIRSLPDRPDAQELGDAVVPGYAR